MREEQHGFDLMGTARRLEDWFLEHVAFPVGAGVPQWPAGRSDAVRVVLMAYWSCHVESHWMEGGGPYRPKYADGCALGVALALLEIEAHRVASLERAEVVWLRQADRITCLSESTRAELLALADQIEATPLSRAVTTRVRGRPRALLADAVARQLRAGGFSYGMIAKFMDSTDGATRARCGATEARSLANFFGANP